MHNFKREQKHPDFKNNTTFTAISNILVKGHSMWTHTLLGQNKNHNLIFPPYLVYIVYALKMFIILILASLKI